MSIIMFRLRTVGGSISLFRFSLKRTLGKRFLSSPRDIRKQPQLNQFQDPNRPPERFQEENKISQPNANFNNVGNANQTYSPGQGGATGRYIPSNGQQRQFRAGRMMFGVTSIVLIMVGTIGIYRSYHAESLSNESIDLLNEALQKESRGDIDEAIGKYLDLLKQLDEEKTPHTNSSYLGAATRIAELYEIKKMPDKALRIYESLSNYLTKQVSEWEPSTLVSNDTQLDTLIMGSLTVATRYAALLPEDQAEKGKKLLLMNIIQAQRRIIEEYPPFITVLNANTNQNILALIAKDMASKMQGKSEEEKKKHLTEALKKPLELPIYTTDPTEENKILGLFAKGWPLFTRALITARDLYANICLEEGDYSEAASCLTTNAVIIQRCFDHPARLGVCLTKLAIVLQLMAETLSEKLDREQEKAGHKGEQRPISHMEDHELSLEDLRSSNLAMNPLQMQNPQIKEFVIEKTYKESERIFQRTLLLIDKLREQHVRNDVPKQFDSALSRSEMVSSCGLALIHYQDGDLKKALKYLQRAKVLAVRINSTDYTRDITEWIDQIEKSNQVEKAPSS